MHSNHRRLLFVLCLFLTACQQRQPYPVSSASKDISTPDIGKGDEQQKPLPLLIIITPEHSFIVTMPQEDPLGLDIKKVPGLVRVLPDGTTRTLRLVEETLPVKKAPIKQAVRSVLEFTKGEESRLLSLLGPQPDFTEAAQAAPNLAPDFWHREKLRLIGVFDSISTWEASVEGFMGGAHPYSSRMLVPMDTETGLKPDFTARFRGSNITPLSPRPLDECVTRLAGVSVTEGPMGTETWIAGFGHTFEFCEGAFQVHPISPPQDRFISAPDTLATLVDKNLALSGHDMRFSGVLDARVHESAVVMLMALGRQDRLPSIAQTNSATVSREIRLWVPGLSMPIVVDRATGLLSVQFLSEHPYSQQILRSFSAL